MYVVTVQSKVEILQISAAFLEYMNLNQIYQLKTTSYFKMGQNSHTATFDKIKTPFEILLPLPGCLCGGGGGGNIDVRSKGC